jgi:hypothetical protein
VNDRRWQFLSHLRPDSLALRREAHARILRLQNCQRSLCCAELTLCAGSRIMTITRRAEVLHLHVGKAQARDRGADLSTSTVCE